MLVTAVPPEEATTTPPPPAADDDVAPAIGPGGAGSSVLVLFFMPLLVTLPLILLVVVVSSVAVAVGRGEATRFGSAPSRRTIHTWHKSTTHKVDAGKWRKVKDWAGVYPVTRETNCPT